MGSAFKQLFSVIPNLFQLEKKPGITACAGTYRVVHGIELGNAERGKYASAGIAAKPPMHVFYFKAVYMPDPRGRYASRWTDCTYRVPSLVISHL